MVSATKYSPHGNQDQSRFEDQTVCVALFYETNIGES